MYALSEQLEFTFSNIDTLSFTETPILHSTIMNYVFSSAMQCDFLYMLFGPWRGCFCSFLQAVGSDHDYFIIIIAFYCDFRHFHRA